MRSLTSVILVSLGAIHLLTLFGVLGSTRPSVRYGIPIDELNAEILTRHRLVLFGLLGAIREHGASSRRYSIQGRL